MTLIIQHPTDNVTERRYVFDVMLGEFLGLSFEAIVDDRQDIRITFPDENVELRVADVLLRTRERAWLKPQSLPALPLSHCELPDDIAKATGIDTIPVLFGKAAEPGNHIARLGDSSIEIGIDIFGSAFFMLTRYEESSSEVVDDFGRFPASESMASRAGFLDRPIVNEYLEILWACLLELKPGLKRRKRVYRLALSHDVDRLYDTRGVHWTMVAKNAIGDVVKRRDVALAANRLRAKAASRGGDYSHEPCNTFEFIMDCSDRYDIHSAFYFLAHQGEEGLDGDYAIDSPWVRSLLRRIHERGHEIGLHASFGSYQDPAKIAAEFATLQGIAESEGVEQAEWGGRQHYLRWAPTTWQSWANAGLGYDATLTYPEAVGYRSGTCFDYPAFDLVAGRPLQLRERPLIVMETTLFSENYMNLSDEDGLEMITKLAATCRQFDGTMSLLWHNDNLARSAQKKFYLNVLKAVS